MSKKRRDKSPKQQQLKVSPEPKRSNLIPWLIVIVAVIVIGFLIARNFVQRTEPQAYAPPAAADSATSPLSDSNNQA